MNKITDLIDKLADQRHLTKNEWAVLFAGQDPEALKYIGSLARAKAVAQFGHGIYTRGLIEFTSYCRNDCYYCGIRRSNSNAQRYRLNKEDILSCCKEGYALGFRTFVLQGGEDLGFKPVSTSEMHAKTGAAPGESPAIAGVSADDWLCDVVASIKSGWPDCAVTLSVGERKHEVYQRFFDAGADRFLLRHETADPEHYRKLHPEELSPENRRQCLWDLKDIGFQVGTGFMVGSPFQTPECLAEDMMFIEELQPHMIGIGPFVPHHDTPFANEKGGTVEETLFCISALRLLMPEALIPATTALGTIAPDGRERGILAGANVVMPNLSPVSVRKKYELYDHKICTGEEAAECRGCLEQRMESIGYTLEVSRGDHPRAAFLKK